MAILYVIGKAGGGAGSTTSGSTASAASEPAAAPVATAPPIEVSARKLFKEYDANEVSADDSYKGKRLRVTGTVQSIDKDFMNHVMIRLGTGNQFIPVDARMEDSEKSNAARLTKGTTVTLICTGHGRTIGRPQLKDCGFAP